MENYAEVPQIEEKTLELIRYYIRKYFNQYSILRQHGIIQDDIESDVCLYMFKTNKKGASFLDKMSEIKTEVHYRAFVKLSVTNTLRTKAREVKNKPILYSLNYTGVEVKDYTDEGLGESLIDKVADTRIDVENEALLDVALSAIENRKYKDLVFYINEKETKDLEVEDLVRWVLSGRTKKALAESVYNKSTKKFMTVKEATNILNKVLEELRKELS